MGKALSLRLALTQLNDYIFIVALKTYIRMKFSGKY